MEVKGDMETPESSRISLPPTEPINHPVARECDSALRNGAIDERGFLSSGRSLPLTVTVAGFPRGIRVLDSLLCAIEAQGHTIEWSVGGHSKLTALVHGETISLFLGESIRLKPGDLQKTLKRPRMRRAPVLEYRTRKLTLYLQSEEFSALCRKRADETARSIEDRIEEIVLELPRMAGAIKEAREGRERQRRERETKQRREEEARQQQREYQRRGEVIKHAAQSLERSQSIRHMVVCLGRSNRINELTHDVFPRFNEMLEWCTEYANSLDPTNQLPCLLEEFFGARPRSRGFGAESEE
jgi:hypothetical protein